MGRWTGQPRRRDSATASGIHVLNFKDRVFLVPKKVANVRAAGEALKDHVRLGRRGRQMMEHRA